MSPIQQMLLGVGAVAKKTYVDDVFSIYTYGSENMGSSAADISINNAIDLASDGGLVWIKRYEDNGDHILADTENGGNKYLRTNSNLGVTTDSNMFKTFNSNGFTVGTDTMVNKWDGTPADRGRYVSYTWKKTKGFFDVVKYQGNSGTAFNVPHSLGVKPGAILIKSLDSSGDWYWWSKGMTTSQWLKFNKKETVQTSSAYQIGANLTSATFQVPTGSEVNNGSDNFIAYLWADGDESAAEIFGESGDKTLMKMGTYTGTGGSNNINIGFEPQWLIIRRFDAGEAENWEMMDCMREWVDTNTEFLQANTTRSEGGESNKIRLTATGFEWLSGGSDFNANNGVYLYMAFRRSDGYVQKPVEDATKVFAMDTGNGSSIIPNYDSGFPVDFAIYTQTGVTDPRWTTARLIGTNELKANDSVVEATYAHNTWDSNVGWNKNGSSAHQSWMWKRHAGFDVVTYKGNSTPGRTVQHNLGKIPEMIWIKCRNVTENWVVGHKGLNGGSSPWEYSLRLNGGEPEVDYPYFNDTAPTSTLFTLNNNGQVNGGSTNTYIAMLFASVDGISKVGYYNGTGSSGLSITTGFQPRMIVIKPAYRLDTYGGAWHMFDTLRGINSGAEYPLRLNTNEPQTVSNHLDYIDLDSDGFTIVSTHQNYNYSGARYIYYAHA